MADRVLKLIENKVTVAVAGGPLVAALVGQAAAAAAQPYVDAAAASAQSAAQQYQDMLDIQAMGDDAAAIAARVPKNTDGSDFSQPNAVRVALRAAAVPAVAAPTAGSGTYATVTASRVVQGESLSGYSRAVSIANTATGSIILDVYELYGQDFSNELVRVDEASIDLDFRLNNSHVKDGRSLAVIRPLGALKATVIGNTGDGLNRVGASFGSNLETLQRGWIDGVIFTGNNMTNLVQNDAFSTYFMISYSNYTLSSGNIYRGMYQSGAGDNEGEYGKSPFSLHNSNIYIDAGTGEGFLNLKGHGWPEATFATKADAEAALSTLNVGALVEITADESQTDSPRAYYQVNSTKTALTAATGGHGHNRSVVGSMFHCTDAYKTQFSAREINGIKVNTDDVVIGDCQFYGPFRAGIVTAGAQTARNLRISNVLFRGGATSSNSGAIQMSAPLATNTTLSNVSVADNPNADALQIAGGEDGADYILTDFIAKGTARGVALRPAAADKITLVMTGGRIVDQSTNAFYLHANRLKKLVVQGVEIDHTPSTLFGGGNKLLLDFVFRNNELRPLTTTTNTITEYARFPVPYGGGLLSTFKVVATDGTDIFEKTVRNLHQSVAGTVSLVGTETVISSHASAGASGWAIAVSVVTDSSGAQMVRLRVTGATGKTIKWKVYADLEGMPA